MGDWINSKTSIADLVSTQAAQTAVAGLQGKLAQPSRRCRQVVLDILAEIRRIDFLRRLAAVGYVSLKHKLRNY